MQKQKVTIPTPTHFLTAHAIDFKNWAKKQRIDWVNEAAGFKVGDTVSFTNDYGVTFSGLTVMGIDPDDSFYGRHIYLNSDAYWFPHTASELAKEQ